MARPVAFLTIHECIDIPKMDTFGWADAYVVVTDLTTNAQLHKTETRKKDKNPRWTDRVAVYGRRIKLTVFDEDVTSDDVIGEVTIDASEVMERAQLPLQGKDAGKAQIIISVTAVSDNRYNMNPATGLGTINPYCGRPTTLPANQQQLPICTDFTDLRTAMPNSKPIPALGEGSAYVQTLTDNHDVFMKHEIPMGLVQRLDALAHFQLIDVIVDDSGSMGLRTDMLHPENGSTLTRWYEVYFRFLWMLEVLSMAPVLPPIAVRFLNRHDVLNLVREPGTRPADFVAHCNSVLSKMWAQGPSGTTPVIRALSASFSACHGPALRYFFGDGVPNEPVQQVVQMIVNRNDPANNPFVFFSCTNKDSDTEWMKECEEAAANCGEYDDFRDEAAEIIHDQGPAFPFSRGLYLMATIIGACYPEDLDAMDEGVPLTKPALDNIMGYISTQQQYEAYFDGMMQAVEHRARSKPSHTHSLADAVKFRYLAVWRRLKSAFFEVPTATALEEVRQYKAELRNAVVSQKGRRH